MFTVNEQLLHLCMVLLLVRELVLLWQIVSCAVVMNLDYSTVHMTSTTTVVMLMMLVSDVFCQQQVGENVGLACRLCMHDGHHILQLQAAAMEL